MSEIYSGIWYTIHKMALSISSTEELHEFEIYMEKLQYILPCNECKANYKQELSILLSQMPNTYGSYKTSLSVFKLTVNLHNNVNRRLGKRILGYTESLTIYDTERLYIDMVGRSTNVTNVVVDVDVPKRRGRYPNVTNDNRDRFVVKSRNTYNRRQNHRPSHRPTYRPSPTPDCGCGKK